MNVKKDEIKMYTLTAWAKLLLDIGKIDLHRYNELVRKIEKLN